MNEMVLIVDFNMVEEDGRIPALVPVGESGSFVPGTEVIAIDGEGTECRAVIDEVAADGSYVMLTPIEGTADASSSEATHRAR
jgi:hypothetical protein